MAYGKEVKDFITATDNGRFFVFDTETTGLKPENADIIEFSAVRILNSGGSFTLEDKLDIFINPGYSIPSEITEITGITDEDIRREAVSAAEALEKITAFWGDSPYVAGYNSKSFDHGFVDKLYKENGMKRGFCPKMHLDVIKMAYEVSSKPFKLMHQAELAGIVDNYRFHRSIDDAMATFDVFRFLLGKYQDADGSIDPAALTMTGIKRWTAYGLDRIYINNTLKISIYYDIAEGKWMVPTGVQEGPALKTIFDFAGVTSQKEFLDKYG